MYKHPQTVIAYSLGNLLFLLQFQSTHQAILFVNGIYRLQSFHTDLPERGKEMATEIPQLKSGSEPADCPVWGTANGKPIKRPGWQHPKTVAILALFQRLGMSSSRETLQILEILAITYYGNHR